MAMTQVGSVSVGGKVMAQREEDEPWELATVVTFDAKSAMLTLLFEGGFRATSVPLSRVQFLKEKGSPSEGAGGKASPPTSTIPPPTPNEQRADPDAKYAYIRAHKEAGNALFKQGRHMDAIRAYVYAVDSLASNCYPSRERMLWDYEARVPAMQCYSNAALCALKEAEWERAAKLCEMAMECRPEDSDLVKVLLRHGQALIGLDEHERAKALLERAAGLDPSNRPVKDQLIKAKKALAAAAKVRPPPATWQRALSGATLA